MTKFYEDEVYIKMCEKAEKYLKDFIPHRTVGYCDQGVVFRDNDVFYNVSEITMPSNLDKIIWLPRQDQLQEMVREESKERYKQNEMKLTDIFQSHELLFERFNDFVYQYDRVKYFHIAQTLSFYEIFWLLFYMKYFHNKTWNGEDWV